MQTELAISDLAGLHDRIAPRPGLALKKFIDVGVGVVDSDYRGEVGVVLFNHGDQDFEVKMEDKIAQIILEKIGTSKVEEVQALKESARGSGGFGSTGVNGKNDTDVEKELEDRNERTEENNDEDKNETRKCRSSGKQRTEKNRKSAEGTFRLSLEKQLVFVNQLKRLLKKKTPVFLAVVWGQEHRKVNAAVNM